MMLCMSLSYGQASDLPAKTAARLQPQLRSMVAGEVSAAVEAALDECLLSSVGEAVHRFE